MINIDLEVFCLDLYFMNIKKIFYIYCYGKWYNVISRVFYNEFSIILILILVLVLNLF